MKEIYIGILALQGDVSEHAEAVADAGAIPKFVRSIDDLKEVAALIIPGGESSTLGTLLEETGLGTEIKQRAKDGMYLYGTCMGLILLSKKITKGSTKNQKLLGLMDIGVERNAYGRQRDSFEVDLSIPSLSINSFPGIFIRAPRIDHVGPEVEILSSFNGAPVLVRERNFLASSFHPELSCDNRIHKYFLQMVKGAKSKIPPTVGGSKVKVHVEG